MNTNLSDKKNIDIEENPFINEIDLKIIFQTLKRKRDLIIKKISKSKKNLSRIIV